MNQLHQKLINKSSHYQKWHAYKHHQHHHWLVAVCAFLISAYAIASAWSININEADKLALGSKPVQAQQADSPSDFTCDQQVGVRDFGILLAFWKTNGSNFDPLTNCPDKNPNLTDPKQQIIGDIIDNTDLSVFLGEWGEVTVDGGIGNGGPYTDPSNLEDLFIEEFNVEPISSFRISWTVTSKEPLEQIEIWRTSDNNGLPNPNNWQELTNLRKTFTSNVTTDTDSRIDDPPTGKWWYGIHVMDVTGEWQSESDAAFVPTLTSKSSTGLSTIEEGQLISREGNLIAILADDFENYTFKMFYQLQADDDKYYDITSAAGLTPELHSSVIRVGGQKSGSASAPSITSGQTALLKKVTLAMPSATGAQRVAVILLNFDNDPTNKPWTKDFVYNQYFNSEKSVSNYFREVSYGKTWLTGQVFGWYTVPALDYCPYSKIDLGIKEADNDVDFSQFNRLVYVFPWHSRCERAGLSSGGEINTEEGVFRFNVNWISDMDSFVITHEQGHDYGVHHANSWECSVAGVYHYGNCESREYGNFYDVMGASWNQSHMNASFKHYLGWLSDSQVPTVTQSGTYTLAPLEIKTSQPQSLRIKRSPYETYYLEYRRPIGFDSNHLYNPALHINFKGRFPASNLIKADFENNKYLLYEGNTFYDPDSGVTVGPIINANDSGITFEVKLGEPGCVRDPYQLTRYSDSPLYTNKFGIHFHVVNNDSFACSDTEYKVSLGAEAPVRWQYVIKYAGRQTDTFSLEAGKTGVVEIEVKVSDNTPLGVYRIPVYLTDLRTDETKLAGETIVEYRPFRVALDSSSPASRTYYGGQKDVVFAKVQFIAGALDIDLGLVKIGSDPELGQVAGQSEYFSNFRVYEGNTLIGQMDKYADVVSRVFWLDWLDFRIPKNSTKILTIVADVESEADAKIRLGFVGADKDPFGLPVYGNTMTFSPDEPPDGTPPKAPANLRDTSRTQSSITWKWDKDLDNTGYKIYHNSTLIDEAPVGTISYTLSNLDCGRDYTIKVEAINENGTNASSDTAATTACAVPPTPICSPPPGSYVSTQNVALSSSGSTQIRYNLDSPAPSSCSSGTKYTGTITVSSSATINSIACDAADNGSAPSSCVYQIGSLPNTIINPPTPPNPSNDSTSLMPVPESDVDQAIVGVPSLFETGSFDRLTPSTVKLFIVGLVSSIFVTL